MSLSDVIASYQTGTYTVTRHADGGYVDGHFVESAPETMFPVDASVQPLDGSTLKDLPEGMSADDVRILWTKVELKGELKAAPGASSDLVGHRPDTIEIDGEIWRVIKVAHFGILDDFYRCTVAKLVPP